jgi:anti-sigma factor RsiW
VTARAVERALAVDPQARARAAMFRETRELVRLAAPRAAGASPLNSIGALHPAAPRWAAAGRGGFRRLLPLAASVLIFLVGGVAGSQIQTWLSPSATKADYLSDIARSYQVFAADGPRTVELGPDERPLIEGWFARRLQHAIMVPDLSRHGLTFGGGRLLAYQSDPVALAVYYTADRKPIGLCIRMWHGNEIAPMTGRRGDDNLVFWTAEKYLHVLIGQADPAFLSLLVSDAGRALTAGATGKPS